VTEQRRKLGPIGLAPGVLPRHVLCYLFAAFISIGVYTYLVTLTPFVFNVNLGLPEADQGTVSGDLQFYQEIVLLFTLGFWGVLSDRIGRRLVYVIGFLIMFLAYGIYAFATTPQELIAYRLVFALGIASTTTCLAAILADYADEKSRGKLTGIAFFLNGLGAIFFNLGLARLPAILSGRGVEELWAGRYSYLLVAAICLLAALVMLGLKPGRPDNSAPKTPVLTLLAEGVSAGRNVRISLSYLSAFAARADMVIVTLFLGLWVVQAASSDTVSTAEATARAGMIIGTLQIASVIWAPIFGFIADRMDKLTLLVVAFAIATLGYGWVATIDDILSPLASPALLLLGMGLSSSQLAATVLLAQESPARIRGSTFGMQAFCGAWGILMISYGGGRLYDAFGPNAPFIAVATANGIVLLCAAGRRLAELRLGTQGATVAAADAPP
jgi:MFS family permease